MLMISKNEFNSPPPPTNNHKVFQDNCYLEGSHVKLHQDGVHLGVNIRCNRETCLPPKVMNTFIRLCGLTHCIF